jgi:hypothetical protein
VWKPRHMMWITAASLRQRLHEKCTDRCMQCCGLRPKIKTATHRSRCPRLAYPFSPVPGHRGVSGVPRAPTQKVARKMHLSCTFRCMTCRGRPSTMTAVTVFAGAPLLLSLSHLQRRAPGFSYNLPVESITAIQTRKPVCIPEHILPQACPRGDRAPVRRPHRLCCWTRGRPRRGKLLSR